MFYKANVNAEPAADTEYWTIVPRGNSGLGSYEPLVTFSSSNQLINLFYVYFYLKIYYLIYIVNPLTLNSHPTVTHAWRKLLSHMYFLCWPHCNHLALSNTRLYFSTLPGATLNSKIINQKHKNAKHGTKITAQRTLVCSMRAETRRQSLILSSQVFKFFPALHVHMSMNDGRSIKHWFWSCK